MVEIEIGVLPGRCLNRRIGERQTPIAKIDPRKRQRNSSGARTKSMFTTERTRCRFTEANPGPPEDYRECANESQSLLVLAAQMDFFDVAKGPPQLER